MIQWASAVRPLSGRVFLLVVILVASQVQANVQPTIVERSATRARILGEFVEVSHLS